MTAALEFFKEANRKYENAEVMDDMELATCIHHYELGLQFLDQLGPSFGLAKNECRRRLDSMYGYLESRRFKP